MIDNEALKVEDAVKKFISVKKEAILKNPKQAQTAQLMQPMPIQIQYGVVNDKLARCKDDVDKYLVILRSKIHMVESLLKMPYTVDQLQNALFTLKQSIGAKLEEAISKHCTLGSTEAKRLENVVAKVLQLIDRVEELIVSEQNDEEKEE